jgi:hypothetical protein
VAAVVASLFAPPALAGTEPAPLGVDSGAEEILRAGYHVERQLGDAGTVTVRVFLGETILGAATGTAGAPADGSPEARIPCPERVHPDDPVVAVVGAEREPVNTP